MYAAYATNIKTKETIELATFISAECAWDNIRNNLVWDKDDVREDWVFDVVEVYENTCDF